MQIGLYHPLQATEAVWRAVSEDSRTRRLEPFLLIARPREIFTAAFFSANCAPSGEYPRINRVSQHIARFYNYSGPRL
jgi:hypothetical protein